MKHKIFLISIICLFFGCNKSDSIDEIDEEFIFNVSTHTYNYCNENWEDTDSSLTIKSGETEIINQELTLGLNSILLPPGYTDFEIRISKDGTEEASFNLTKEEIKAYKNSVLEINLNTKIFEGDLIIDTLEKYNNLITSNYGRVDGSLVIANINNLQNFNNLSSLTSIKEGLRIINLENIKNLDGINNIKCIGGDLSIYNNPSIININSLSNLSYIGDYVWIQDNQELINLEGLNNIASLKSDLEILNNNKLVSLDGIDNIKSIEGEIYISGNETLTSITALSGLTEVKKDLSIKGNFKLTSLSGLNNITSIASNFYLTECRINSLEGLNNLIFIGESLQIYNNSFLYDWCPLQNLFINNGLGGGHLFGNCSFNPSIQNIIDGNCSP